MKLAGAREGRLEVWIDDWHLESRGENHHLKAQKDGIGLDHLTPSKPPVLHGEGGYSRKASASDAASYYYSITRLATRGKLFLGKRSLGGDRDQLARPGIIHQPPGPRPSRVGLVLPAALRRHGSYALRHAAQKRQPRCGLSGTRVDPHGQARHLTLADFTIRATGSWQSPHSGATYPSGWQVKLPGAGYSLTVQPTLADQELRTGMNSSITYWEGQAIVQGTGKEGTVTGQGYGELTGYAGSLGGRF